MCSGEESRVFTCIFSRLKGRREFSIHCEMEISQGSAFLYLSPRCFAQVPAQQIQQGCCISQSHRKKKICGFVISPGFTAERSVEGHHPSQPTFAVQPLSAGPTFLLRGPLAREMPLSHSRRPFRTLKYPPFPMCATFLMGTHP